MHLSVNKGENCLPTFLLNHFSAYLYLFNFQFVHDSKFTTGWSGTNYFVLHQSDTYKMPRTTPVLHLATEIP